MKLNFLPALLLPLLLAGDAGACAHDLLIESDGLGAVRLGHSAADLLRQFPEQILETKLTQSEVGLVRALQYRRDNRVIAHLELDERNRVEAIHIEDPSVRTTEGVGVGSTLQEVRVAYPTAVPIFGPEEGGFLSLAIRSISFSFDVVGIDLRVLAVKQLDFQAVENFKVQVVLIHEPKPD